MTIPGIAAVLSGAARWHVEQGDCLDVLRTLPDESIDAVVTDPPAGIAFMGKAWDHDKGGRAEWIAWLASVMRECLRVLKPGGHALVWALPRTSHWTGTACEEAGFEVRDRLSHLFGCLSEDTELLVDGRWERCRKSVEGRRALCYDAGHDVFTQQPIEAAFFYDYDDTAFRVRGDSTDQIVTREHRCLVERGGTFVFVRAEEAAQEREARVPVLEDLPALLAALPVPDERASGSNEDMPAMPRGVACAPEAGGLSHAARRVQAVRVSVPAEVEYYDDEGSLLFSEVLGRGSVGGPGACASDADNRGTRAVRLDTRKSVGLPGEDERRAQPGMEGRRDVLSEARELQADQVHSLPAGIPADGAQRWVRHGAPPDCGASAGALPASDGSGSPRQPRPTGQPTGKPGALPDEQGAQGVRGARFTRADLVRFEPIRYRGTVWCVRVPTGAFVARRAGKVFVTGNSGFPKSLDVSKAIAAQRAIGGSSYKQAGQVAMGDKYIPSPAAGSTGTRITTGGATTNKSVPGADNEWAGFGTALKPAVEDWWLCRKPIVGTVAGNLLAHGTGAINIDGCRIGRAASDVSGWSESGSHASGNRAMSGGNSERAPKSDAAGRWPPNLLLSHAEGCRPAGTRAVTGSNKTSPSLVGPSHEMRGGYGHRTASPIVGYASPDGTETVEAWDCAPGCPVAEMDRQSGPAGAAARASGPTLTSGNDSVARGHFNGLDRPAAFHDDAGAASRFFPTFRYCAKASRAEREDGCGELPARLSPETVGREPDSAGAHNPRAGANRGAGAPIYRCARCGLNLQGGRRATRCPDNEAHEPEQIGTGAAVRNHHPTVKGDDLMRWLVRLVTPPDGIILDCFAGSGSTGRAAILEGFRFIGIEREADYVAIARARIAAAMTTGHQPALPGVSP